MLVVCEVKTRTSDACGTPHEAVDAAKVERLRRLADQWVAGHAADAGRGAHRPGRRDPAAQGALGASSTCGGSADAGRDRPHHLAVRARSATSSTCRPTSRSGLVGDRRWWAGPTWPSTRPATGAGWRSSTAGSTGRRPSGSRSCSRRPTCPSAAPTSTWPSPWPCWPPTATIPAAALEDTVFVGELTLTAGCARSRACCPWCWPPSRAASASVFVPEPQAREAAMVPGHGRCSACGRCAQVVAQLRGEEVPEAPPVAPMSGRQPARLARAEPARGARPGRRRRDGGRPVRRSRSPRPAATT